MGFAQLPTNADVSISTHAALGSAHVANMSFATHAAQRRTLLVDAMIFATLAAKGSAPTCDATVSCATLAANGSALAGVFSRARLARRSLDSSLSLRHR
jgi:hypothetical protein